MEKKIRKLDNSAKIFPMMSSKKYSSVFRLSVQLKETIKPDLLQKATEKALETYSSFKVSLKGGFFWYYYAENKNKPVIRRENAYPCKYIDPKKNNGYLFQVTYQDCRINIDIFHALTDGNSGIHFLKEIVYNYLDLSHQKELADNHLRAQRKIHYTTEDSYITHYDKKLPGNANTKKAYILQGKLLENPQIGVIYEKIKLEQLRYKAKANGATITQYLTSILAYAIYQANYLKYNGKKPIKICIPVDLKKYFKSETINNFFSYITVEIPFNKRETITLSKILELVKEEFHQKLTENEIKKTMSANVRLGKNWAIGIIPLFLKKIVVKLSYMEIRKYTTITFSNIGRIGTIRPYSNFIQNFSILIAPEPVEKIKCSSCSHDNELIFTFTSTLKEADIEKQFYEILTEEGIEVKIEDNAVHQI